MILVGNGRVITRDPRKPFLELGAVLIDNNKICEVGRTEELQTNYPNAEYIDANRGVIMPSLINAHNHIYSAFARGLSIRGHNPKNFIDILEGMWWTLDRKLTLKQIKLSAAATYIDCIKNGVTSIFDHHASYGAIESSLFVIAEESKKYGIRSCLCYEVSDRDGQEKCNQAIRENSKFIQYAKEDQTGLLMGMMGLHAAFTLSNQTLERCAASKPSESGYHIHVAEGITDLHHSLQKYGKRIVDRFMDFDILGSKTIAGHCIYINSHEMELLKATDTIVVHNPESNMGNAVGCPPTLEIMNHGILTGLGTDGYTNDMLESMKVANLLHKHNTCNPNAAWGEVPAMLFENNAKIAARYFGQKLGILEKGAAADLIILDYQPMTPMDECNYNGHILFGMNGSMVTTTIANGKVLMKNRELIGIDEERILSDCREEAEKLWNSING